MSRCQLGFLLFLLLPQFFLLGFPRRLPLLELAFILFIGSLLLSQFGFSLNAGFLAMGQAVQFVVHGHGFFIEATQFFFFRRHGGHEGLAPLFGIGQCFGRFLFFRRCRLAAVFGFGQEAFAVAQLLQGQSSFIGQSFAVEGSELLQCFSLFLQGFQLLFEDTGKVADAFQIAFRFRNFSQAFGFSPLKAADAGHFFKDDPPFFRLAVQDAIDAVLADDGHGILTDTGVGKKDMDIL